MKLYKIVFINSMIMGTLISISSYSWLSMWMGLEINLLSIIPLFTNSKNIYSSESSLKYFITQAMASMILLMAVMMLLLNEEFISPQMNLWFTMMMNSALLTKMGAAPFHYWFPEVIEGLNWTNSFILLTWQKIAPMMLLMNMKINIQFITAIIITSLIISTISGFNQISLRKILAFSSINHIAWMLSSLMMSLSMWTIYFIVYTIINLNVISMFKLTNSYFINQINNMMNQNKMIKLSFMINFMSLGGLPPFLGFMPKWLVINWMTDNNLMTLTFIMIVTTLIMLFVYIRIMMSSMMLFLNEPKNINLKINQTKLILMNMISVPSLIVCTLIPSFM
uniref:NADH-ubiquinone oxidoreductase chain 2 n=1 Tax=Alphitobius diaperinus TaxID=27448 RepID=A0A6M8PXX7_ALPDA|nr:NADH dehydrogenase subunit 2 [Alphitobius diaperinus]QKI32129.1 NADH dehydrogenase subunit 2 [Alphitobius diaperinus]QNK05471.1 NADH dehydrogenase subunit 2 [Alphitobius diaperinus]